MKKVILAAIILLTSVVQAGVYKGLSTYHLMEGARTGNMNHAIQGMNYNTIDRMQERREREEQERQERLKAQVEQERQQRAFELIQQEQQAEQERQEQLRQFQQLEERGRAEEAFQQGKQIELQQVEVMQPQVIQDPVTYEKSRGGVFAWKNGLCYHKLPNGQIELMGSMGLAIRLCSRKNAPQNVYEAYEKLSNEAQGQQ